MQVRPLSSGEIPAARDRLGAAPRSNLMLLDLVARLAGDGPAEPPPQILGAWRGAALAGVVALQPSLVIDATMDAGAVAVLAGSLDFLEAGLLKGAEAVVTPLWKHLARRSRNVLLDRLETAYAFDCPIGDAEAGVGARRAVRGDLDALVAAARASLRDEDRPDPFPDNPSGFRAWVRSRVACARVVEAEGRVAFVAYADVQRREGWLVQGVYTFPAQRRCGLARIGLHSLIAEASAAGADHLQLSVVEGNLPAVRLYQSLGFEPFETLRTVLFV